MEVILTDIDSKLKENFKTLLPLYAINYTSVWTPVKDTEFIFIHRP